MLPIYNIYLNFSSATSMAISLKIKPSVTWLPKDLNTFYKLNHFVIQLAQERRDIIVFSLRKLQSGEQPVSKITTIEKL